MGVRFCSLDQLYKEMKYFRRRNWMKNNNKKKAFVGIWSHFFPKPGEDQKKKVSAGNWSPFSPKSSEDQ